MVEFVGRAGVGKSTIVRALATILRGRGIESGSVVGSDVPLLGRVAPREAVRACRMGRVLALPLTVGSLRRTLSLYKELLKLRYARALPGLTLLDQGWLQKLEPMKLDRRPDERQRASLRRAMQGAPFADLVVVVSASPAALAARRNATRRLGTTAEREEVADHLTTKATIDDVRALLSYGGPRPVRLEVVMNEAPGDDARIAGALADTIEALLSGADGRGGVHETPPSSG